MTDLPPAGLDEAFETLLERPDVRVERIVSWGHTTEIDWYDQAWDEWVLVLAGAARLRIEGGPEHVLGAGDSLMLPAHCRHRVEWTTPDGPTVWLAIHLG